MSRNIKLLKTIIALLSLSTLLFACESQRVIYKEVPEWKLKTGLIQERIVLEDGTIIIHKPRSISEMVGNGEGKTVADTTGRNEDEDGNVILRALLPEQLLAHLQQCIFDTDWQLCWDQVLAKRTRKEYEKGGGYEEFADYLQRNRDELYATLSRMTISLRSPEVVMEPGPYGGTRCRFHRTLASEFQFAAIDMVYEPGGMKILMIHPYFE